MFSRYGKLWVTVALAIGVLVSGIALAAGPGAQSEDPQPGAAAFKCKLRKLAGTWGVRVDGTLMAPLTPGTTAAVGLLTVERDGTFTGTDVLAFNDLIVPRLLEGSVVLGDDCTGTAQFMDSLGQTIDVSLVVVADGNEILFIQTNAGAVVTGVMRRQ